MSQIVRPTVGREDDPQIDSAFSGSNIRPLARRMSAAVGPQRVRCTVIIPAFNEASAIGSVLADVTRAISSEDEVIVVDDGSSDGTSEAARIYPVRVVRLRKNSGKAVAMRTGVDMALGRYIIFIDADGTYPAEAIPVIIRELGRYDVVYGVRRTGRSHIPSFNRLGNWGFQTGLRTLYGFRGRDPLTGLYGIRTKHLKEMGIEARGFDVEAELAIKASRRGLTATDVEIDYADRIGESKLHPLKDGARILRLILGMLARFNPTLAFVIPGLLLAIAGVICLGATQQVVGVDAVAAGLALATVGAAVNLQGVATGRLQADRFTRGCLAILQHSSIGTLALAASAISFLTLMVLFTFGTSDRSDATLLHIALVAVTATGINIFGAAYISRPWLDRLQTKEQAPLEVAFVIESGPDGITVAD